jgi:excisionase family DNA binding protein
MSAAKPLQQHNARNANEHWTSEKVRGLGLTTDVETAAAILGIGRTKAYELAKAGDFPVTILRVGRRYLVPTNALLALLSAP